MKKNDIIDLKAKSEDELMRLSYDLRVEVNKLKLDEALGKVKNTNELVSKRKDLARVLTFLRMKKGEMQIK